MFTKKDLRAGHAAMLESPNYTRAQHVRQRFMMRRQRKHDERLTITEAVYRGCSLVEEVTKAMQEKEVGLKSKDLTVLLGVQHDKDGGTFAKFVTLTCPEISKTLTKLRGLKNPMPLGVVFQLTDYETEPEPNSRIWIRSFLAGDEVLKVLMQAATSGSKETVNWSDAVREVMPISLRMATTWAHPDGRSVNLPWEDRTTQASLAEVELREEGFGPVHVLAIIPEESGGLKIRVVTIPEMGTAERVLAITVQPASVFAFRKQAEADGITEQAETVN